MAKSVDEILGELQGGQPRFSLLNGQEFLSRPGREIEWMIEGIWVKGARGLIAGNPGVGKTWLALDMLLAVATGGLCMGKYQAIKSPALLVEEEGSELHLQRRIHALARARQLKESELASLFFIIRQFTKIPQDLKALCHLIMLNDIKLVVFDSLRRFHNKEENSSSEMQEVLDAFGRLNQITGAAVILIHHLSKQTENSHRPLFERLRGSSDFLAWRDCVIGVEGEEDATESVASFQFRDADPTNPIRIKRHVGELTGAIGLEATGLEESEEIADKIASILNVMTAHLEPLSKDQILTSTKGRKQDLARAFKIMIDRRMVLKSGSKWIVPDSAGTNGNDGNEILDVIVPSSAPLKGGAGTMGSDSKHPPAERKETENESMARIRDGKTEVEGTASERRNSELGNGDQKDNRQTEFVVHKRNDKGPEEEEDYIPSWDLSAGPSSKPEGNF